MRELPNRGNMTPAEKKKYQELKARLEEAESTLRAIREGEADAVVVKGAEGEERIYILQGAESSYRLFLEHMHEGAATVTRAGVVVFANRSFAEILGLALPAVLGKSIEEVVSSESVNMLAQTLKQPERTETVQLRITTKDGVDKPIELSCSPAAAGEDGLFNLVAVDLSEREALSMAEQASAAKDQFLAFLSHELRTPLAPAMSALQLLDRTEELSPNGRSCIDIIRRNLAFEARLIDDLLDVTRIAKGKVNLEEKPVNLCNVLKRVVEICKPEIEAKRIAVSLDVEGANCTVIGDGSRLQQVFWNLLKNSIKFTPSGGYARITARPDNGRLIIEVADNGIGIERDAISRIFDAFEQANKRITREFGGLGLGLAISKRLVEMHGGTISAHSGGKGQGATFKVDLPLIGQESAEDTAVKRKSGSGSVEAPGRGT